MGKILRALSGKINIIQKNDRLRKRMLTLFFVIFLLPIVLIVSVYFRFSYVILKNEISQLTLRSLEQIKDNLAYRFNDTAETSISVMSSLYPYLNRPEQEKTLTRQLEDFSSIGSLLSNYVNRNMVSNIRLYVGDDKMYSTQRDTFYPLSALEKIDHYIDALSEGRRTIWEETRRTQGTYFRPAEQYIACVTVMASNQDFGQLSGVLFFHIPEDRISQVLELGLHSRETVYLVNAQGVILSHKEKEKIGQMGLWENELERVKGSGSEIIESDEEMVGIVPFSYPDWYLVARVPAQDIYRVSGWPLYTVSLLSVAGIILLLVLALILLFTSVMEQTINRVNRAVTYLETNGIHTLSGWRESEIDSLSGLEKNIDRLVETIKNLLEESYRSKLESREAHLTALQAQINPHFLYNTLDNIKWMIMNRDTEQGVWMVNSLSRYFRLSLNKGRDVVPLRDEYDLMMTYLGIQQRRFPGRFEVRTEIDEQTLPYPIPKLSLQPIVENALQHGLKGGAWADGSIRIQTILDGDIYISVSDNGCGMSEDEAAAIWNAKAGGFGLRNVSERICLFCGEGYGVDVKSVPGGGTTVTIRLRPDASYFDGTGTAH